LLNPDFRDILSEFCAAGVEFLLVGAYALAAHGLPRATGDIDLWVRCSEQNAQRVMTALAHFGAPLTNITAADFVTPDIVSRSAARRVDILTAIDGVEFEEAWPERMDVEIEGMRVSVLGRAHLIRNKRAAGRPKDLADASWLEAAGSD
jgi:hypothetical protein